MKGGSLGIAIEDWIFLKGDHSLGYGKKKPVDAMKVEKITIVKRKQNGMADYIGVSGNGASSPYPVGIHLVRRN